jgi:hypothetical protein
MKYLMVTLIGLTLSLQTQAQLSLPVQDLLSIMYDEAGVKAHAALGYPISHTDSHDYEAVNALVGTTIHYEFNDRALELTFLSTDRLSMRTIYPKPDYDGMIPYTLTRLENGEEVVEFTTRNGQLLSCYHDFETYTVTLQTETGHWTNSTLGAFSLETFTVR